MSNPFEIDKYQLDVEWSRQPKLMRYFTKKLAHAKKVVRDLKQEIKAATASLSLRARKHPSKFGIDKVTDKSIDSAVQMHPRIRELEEELSEAMFEMDMCDSAVASLENKKSAIHDLVHLHTIGYFAEMKANEAKEEFLSSRKPKGVKPRNSRKTV